VWRPIFQNFFGIGRQSPSEDLRIRGEHDQQMRDWAASHPKLMLIAGHTHKAVWPEDGERPCYLNTGCCKFSDGSITGVEIEGGNIHLIQWREADQDPTRARIRSGALAPFFGKL
jgi:UDP-2,3-diacylglucosamine pyrophosphatase LpxH